jgi:hypothetical protein
MIDDLTATATSSAPTAATHVTGDLLLIMPVSTRGHEDAPLAEHRPMRLSETA